MKNNFKVGDIVLVYKKDNDCYWAKVMDRFLNKKAIIIAISNDCVLLRQIDKHFSFAYYFPFKSIRSIRNEKFRRILNE